MIFEIIILLLFLTGLIIAVSIELFVMILTKSYLKVGGVINAKRMDKDVHGRNNNSDTCNSYSTGSYLHDEGYNKKLERYVNCIYHDPYECDDPEACENCELRSKQYV